MEKRHFIAHGYFTLWVLLLSLIPLASYWWVMPTPDSLHGQLYLISSLGYYGLLLTITALVFSPLASTAWTRPLYALLLTLWLLQTSVLPLLYDQRLQASPVVTATLWGGDLLRIVAAVPGGVLQADQRLRPVAGADCPAG